MMNSTPTSVTSTSTDPWSQKNPCSGPDHHDFSSSFLQHASGQGISGVCVWAAILITCHQVGISFFLSLLTVLFRIGKSTQLVKHITRPFFPKISFLIFLSRITLYDCVHNILEIRVRHLHSNYKQSFLSFYTKKKSNVNLYYVRPGNPQFLIKGHKQAE